MGFGLVLDTQESLSLRPVSSERLKYSKSHLTLHLLNANSPLLEYISNFLHTGEELSLYFSVVGFI